MDNKQTDNRKEKYKKTILSDPNIWNCLRHPGCLISIPCDCENCIRYNNYLTLKINQSRELSSSK